MAEGLRQRGGGSSAQAVADASYEPTLYMGGGSRFKEDEVEDIIKSSVLPRTMYKMASTSNSTQAIKDKLAKAPYDMELIKELGFAYASEVQWDQAANVMIRGLYRIQDLQKPRDRFLFLMKLAEASFRNRQFLQAEKALMQTELPEEISEKRAWQLLMCHTLCEIKTDPKYRAGKRAYDVEAQKQFKELMDGCTDDFETALKIWAACALRLKAAGIYDLCKPMVLAAAKVDQTSTSVEAANRRNAIEARITTVESWAMMSATKPEEKSMFNLEDGIQPWMIKAAIGFVSFIFIYILYLLEKRSLAALKL